MNTTIDIQTVCNRWSDPAARPLFKGALIDETGCCCAQGDVLRLSGYTDDQLRAITQEKADKEVARLLGISTTHAVLLRNTNDQIDGCPQDVLLHPEKIVGAEWPTIEKFWHHLDRMTPAARNAAGNAAGNAAWNAAGNAAWNAAWNAAGNAARNAARNAAWNAAGNAAGNAARNAAGNATSEIQGRSILNAFFFLPMFGFNTPEDIK